MVNTVYNYKNLFRLISWKLIDLYRQNVRHIARQSEVITLMPMSHTSKHSFALISSCIYLSFINYLKICLKCFFVCYFFLGEPSVGRRESIPKDDQSLLYWHSRQTVWFCWGRSCRHQTVNSGNDPCFTHGIGFRTNLVY